MEINIQLVNGNWEMVDEKKCKTARRAHSQKIGCLISMDYLGNPSDKQVWCNA